jgi:secondary thiamine-phosphate synthase enzyme
MPAHIKSTISGVSINIPITNGKLNLGTWQGIWLCEFRDEPTQRNIVVTIHGE